MGVGGEWSYIPIGVQCRYWINLSKTEDMFGDLTGLAWQGCSEGFIEGQPKENPVQIHLLRLTFYLRYVLQFQSVERTHVYNFAQLNIFVMRCDSRVRHHIDINQMHPDRISCPDLSANALMG